MRQLSNKEKKEIIEYANSEYGLELNKKDNFQLIDDEAKVVVINNAPYFFYHENRIVPTLKLLQERELLKKAVVDMGAVKFIVSGADIMRPGIVRLDEGIERNELIAIVDETHQKALAVGVALFSGEEIISMKTGKVVKNIHWVGDKIWNSITI